MNKKLIDALAEEAAGLLQLFIEERYTELIHQAITEAMENNCIDTEKEDAYEAMMEIAGRITVKATA